MPKRLVPPTLRYSVRLLDESGHEPDLRGNVLFFYGANFVEIGDDQWGAMDRHRYRLKDGRRKAPARVLTNYRIADDELEGLRRLQSQSALDDPAGKTLIDAAKRDGAGDAELALLQLFIDGLRRP